MLRPEKSWKSCPVRAPGALTLPVDCYTNCDLCNSRTLSLTRV
jgi:hypothetical protein